MTMQATDSSGLAALSDQIGVVESTTPTQRHSAALTVVEAAHDPADARLLLDMLGLGGAR